MNSQKSLSISLVVAVALIMIAGFYGCASYEAQNKETLLSAAGFQTRTPSTPEQQAMFNRMVPYKVERRVRNGKVLYAYADKQRNVVYIGGESEYQRHKQLGVQQSIAQEQLEAAPINEETSGRKWGTYWGAWHPLLS